MATESFLLDLQSLLRLEQNLESVYEKILKQISTPEISGPIKAIDVQEQEHVRLLEKLIEKHA